MIKVSTKKLILDNSIKQRFNKLCDFWNIKPIYKDGSLRKIDKTNLAYIEPHRIYIKDFVVLVYENQEDFYINNLSNKVSFADIRNYLARK